MRAALTQKFHEQHGQDRFANASVRAGDEKRLLHSPTSKRNHLKRAIKTIDEIGVVQLPCAARLNENYCEHHR